MLYVDHSYANFYFVIVSHINPMCDIKSSIHCEWSQISQTVGAVGTN